VVAIAASGALDEFASLTEGELLENMRGKFFGQVKPGPHRSALRQARRFVHADIGVFADVPARV
jgi:hypothetical protein